MDLRRLAEGVLRARLFIHSPEHVVQRAQTVLAAVEADVHGQVTRYRVTCQERLRSWIPQWQWMVEEMNHLSHGGGCGCRKVMRDSLLDVCQLHGRFMESLLIPRTTSTQHDIYSRLDAAVLLIPALSGILAKWLPESDMQIINEFRSLFDSAAIRKDGSCPDRGCGVPLSALSLNRS